MSKTLAPVAALACVVLVAISAPRADVTAYRYGLTGNDWWAGQRHRPAAVAPVALHYGLMENDWWAARRRRGTPAN